MRKITDDITEIVSEEYILEARDIPALKAVLDYAYHRMAKHKKYFFADFKDVQRLRREFGILTDEKYAKQTNQM